MFENWLNKNNENAKKKKNLIEFWKREREMIGHKSQKTYTIS